MRNSNRYVRDWLLENKFDYIWFKPHHDTRKNKYKEVFYTKDGTFYQIDLWNLFDGICIDRNGIICFLQISTNKFHGFGPYQKFKEGKFGFRILLFNVKKSKRWKVTYHEI